MTGQRRSYVAAADVGLVRLVDQIGPALAVPDQLAEQVRSPLADNLRVQHGDRRLGLGHEAIDLARDLAVFDREGVDGVGQAQVAGQDRLVEPVGTFGDLDVFLEVLGQLDEDGVYLLAPHDGAAGRGRGQRSLEATHRVAQFGPPGTDGGEFGIGGGNGRFHEPPGGCHPCCCLTAAFVYPLPAPRAASLVIGHTPESPGKPAVDLVEQVFDDG